MMDIDRNCACPEVTLSGLSLSSLTLYILYLILLSQTIGLTFDCSIPGGGILAGIAPAEKCLSSGIIILWPLLSASV